ncbi:MAG: hypothetical protein LBJ95_01315 [Oscillospiraceae bacterium]|jgi:hypothetical protein|nr:hypothetical protein [Oscillospiraceae bacterium]
MKKLVSLLTVLGLVVGWQSGGNASVNAVDPPSTNACVEWLDDDVVGLSCFNLVRTPGPVVVTFMLTKDPPPPLNIPGTGLNLTQGNNFPLTCVHYAEVPLNRPYCNNSAKTRIDDATVPRLCTIGDCVTGSVPHGGIRIASSITFKLQDKPVNFSVDLRSFDPDGKRLVSHKRSAFELRRGIDVGTVLEDMLAMSSAPSSPCVSFPDRPDIILEFSVIFPQCASWKDVVLSWDLLTTDYKPVPCCYKAELCPVGFRLPKDPRLAIWQPDISGASWFHKGQYDSLTCKPINPRGAKGRTPLLQQPILVAVNSADCINNLSILWIHARYTDPATGLPTQHEQRVIPRIVRPVRPEDGIPNDDGDSVSLGDFQSTFDHFGSCFSCE